MEGRKVVLTGLTTGFAELDEKTSGLQRSDLIIVAARPSIGKTSFALMLAQNAAIQTGAVVGIFSLEMSKEALVMRMLCSQGNIDAQRFRNGFLSRAEWAQIAKSLGTLADLRESGALEQDADLVAFLYREEMYKSPEERQNMPDDKKNVAELILAKQRNGPTGTIELRFVPSSMRFDNLYRE